MSEVNLDDARRVISAAENADHRNGSSANEAARIPQAPP